MMENFVSRLEEVVREELRALGLEYRSLIERIEQTGRARRWCGSCRPIVT